MLTFMKNLKKIYLAIFCLSLVVYTGCSDDDDDDLRVYEETYDSGKNKTVSRKISSLETKIIAGISTLRISGGGGNYTATSSDENTISVSILENYLHIDIHNIGKANITITGADKTSMVLPVTVSESTRSIRIEESFVQVEQDNQQTEPEEIINGIKNSLLPAGAIFDLTYNLVTDDSYTKEGTFVLHINSTETKGTFKEEYIREENNSYHLLTFEAGDIKYEFSLGKFPLDYNSLRTSIYNPIYFWVADYAEEYKNKYPDMAITKAIGIQRLYIPYYNEKL